jgi:hypothetical protein
MKIFFYVGPNKDLKSGFSIKFWKIERKGSTVTASWGPAQVDRRKRRGCESKLEEEMQMDITVCGACALRDGSSREEAGNPGILQNTATTILGYGETGGSQGTYQKHLFVGGKATAFLLRRLKDLQS